MCPSKGLIEFIDPLFSNNFANCSHCMYLLPHSDTPVSMKWKETATKKDECEHIVACSVFHLSFFPHVRCGACTFAVHVPGYTCFAIFEKQKTKNNLFCCGKYRKLPRWYITQVVGCLNWGDLLINCNNVLFTRYHLSNMYCCTADEYVPRYHTWER